MAADVRDEDLMRRFIVGDVSAEERARVESEFIDNPGYFEALCALEGEMFTQHVRHELPAEWRSRFDASVLASPDRRRRVEEMATLIAALEARDAPARVGRTQPVRTWRKWTWPEVGLVFAGAAALVALVVAGRTWSPGGRSPAPMPVAGAPLTPPAVATFLLVAGQTRAPSDQGNLVRIPAGAEQIRLALEVTGEPIAMPQLELRAVGGGPMAVAATPAVQRTSPNAVTVSWLVPARALPRGDYILTLSGQRASGERETIGTRFFSVVE